MAGECPRLWEVDAYREGRLGAKDAARFERHARMCAACATRMEKDDQLRRLARDLPPGEPDELEVRRVRADVMRALATGGARGSERRKRLVAGAAVAAVVAGVIAWRAAAPRSPAASAAEVATSAPALAAYTGSVVALVESRWTQSREGDVERVRMESGRLRVHVRPQRAGERFLVVLPDGDLEVRGTTFEVAVEGARTVFVHVDEGVVELRLRDRSARRLAAGDMWQWSPAVPVAPLPVVVPAPAFAAPAVPIAPIPPASARGAGSASTRIATVHDEASGPYKAAVQLLLDGRSAEAAAAFEAFVLAHPGAPQTEDASYLEAVALARAGRSDAAGLAAEQHLRRFPASFHATEAAGLVALAASQRGDCARARAVVAEWVHGPPQRDAKAALRACEGK